jgi:hypothetical protein
MTVFKVEDPTDEEGDFKEYLGRSLEIYPQHMLNLY